MPQSEEPVTATAHNGPQHPRVNCWRDVSGPAEKITFSKTGEEIVTSTFFAVDSDFNAFLSEVPGRRRENSLEKVVAGIYRIPDHEIYPRWTSDLPVYRYQGAIAAHIYVKQPRLAIHPVCKGSTWLADTMKAEAETGRLVLENPHPNIIAFQGCVVRDSRIVGLTFHRCPALLALEIHEHRIMPSVEMIERWMAQLRSAVDHLHSLGIAHNDINPRNIMQDEGCNMVLIDLGSCVRLGEVLRERGTLEWNEWFGELSCVENDDLGLQ